MSRGILILIGIAIVLAAAGITAWLLMRRQYAPRPLRLTVEGAVLRQGVADKQVPLAGAVVAVRNDGRLVSASTSDDGFFHLRVTAAADRFPLTLSVQRPGYWPESRPLTPTPRLYVIRLFPTRLRRPPAPQRQIPVANVLVRYTVLRTTAVNVGSSARTFQVRNQANQPCRHRPCSPHHRWQAAAGELILDAGQGNLFHNARVSCIAGPCPFTRMDAPQYLRGGRVLRVSALNWSDTATFLVEAEVFHPMASTSVRRSYPVIFGRVLNFTVPANAEGVSLEATVKGLTIVYPLGPQPNPVLPWTSCINNLIRNRSVAFRCTLQPGYRF